MYDCVSGQAVNVGVTMYVLSISSLSEVEMVLLLGLSLVLIMFSIEKSLALMFEHIAKSNETNLTRILEVASNIKTRLF